MPRRQCSKKSRVKRPPLPAVSGPADFRRRQRAAHGVDGVVVQLVKLLRRAAPVADVRLVPDLPIPRLDFLAAVSLDAMLHPLVDQLAPTSRSPSADRPSRCRSLRSAPRRPLVLVRLGLDRKVLGHEADLRVGPHAALEIRVEDPVQNRPVVDRLSLGVFAVGAGRAPLERGRAVAGGQQVVRAEIDLLAAAARRARRRAFCRASCRRSSARPRRRTARSA